MQNPNVGDNKNDRPSEVNPIWRERRRFTALLAVALVATGFVLMSRECLVAGLVCAGGAAVSKKLFG